MQEEIGKYRFANSIRWLTENINDVDHMLELGGWYGTIAHSVSRLKQFKSYIVYDNNEYQRLKFETSASPTESSGILRFGWTAKIL